MSLACSDARVTGLGGAKISKQPTRGCSQPLAPPQPRPAWPVVVLPALCRNTSTFGARPEVEAALPTSTGAVVYKKPFGRAVCHSSDGSVVIEASAMTCRRRGILTTQDPRRPSALGTYTTRQIATWRDSPCLEGRHLQLTESTGVAQHPPASV